MKKPNILLIMCDQLNASVLGAEGGPVNTPNISGLAEDGIVFNAAYCQTPFCTPSRASLITGLYPHKHGLVSNVMRVDYPAVGGPETEEGIDSRDITTEGILNQRGYQTLHYGKWHLSGTKLPCYKEMYAEHLDYGREMREKFNQIASGPRDSYMNWYDWMLPITVDKNFAGLVPGIRKQWDAKNSPRFVDFLSKMGRLDLPREDSYDYRVAVKCAEALGRTNGPFMLTCSFNWPHDPNVALSPYYDAVDKNAIRCDVSLPCEKRYLNEVSKAVPALAGNEFLKEFLRIYYANVMFIDEQVGRVIEALKKSGQYENTVVIFTSDHGDMAGGHGMFWKSTSAFYDEVSRVPLIIRAPGFEKGARCNAPVELVDIMPTILELCGIDAPSGTQGGIDGKSLVPILAGGKAAKDTAFSERLHGQKDRRRSVHTNDEDYGFMLRHGMMKYVVHKNGEELTELLYNLESDPQEYVNLAKENDSSAELEAMRLRLNERLHSTGYTGNAAAPKGKAHD